jgi:glycosyltransferase involved in cell wall biosynthesis
LLSTLISQAQVYRANGFTVLALDSQPGRYSGPILSPFSSQIIDAPWNRNLGTHGTFAAIPQPPDFSKRGNPEHRILAFGNWGTYKRLDKLMEAFPAILEKVPNARLIVAGGNHPAAQGYWESIRDAQPPGLPVEFRGYIPQADVPALFQTSSLLVMPYDSSTGSSGPAHQACEFGVPIVCADIADFRCMAADDDMAILFYKLGDPTDLAEKISGLLLSPELQHQMSEHNYAAGIEMTMATVARSYLRWFKLKTLRRSMEKEAGSKSLDVLDGLAALQREEPAEISVPRPSRLADEKRS